jgi:hypothetical protein
VLLLAGGLVLASYGTGVTPAVAQGVPSNGGLTSGWDNALPEAHRFVILKDFKGAAVLDRNTGLVWEKAPDVTRGVWTKAAAYCLNKEVGRTRGWRLPSVAELASLIDPALPAPFVPASAFTVTEYGGTTPGVFGTGYWTATTVADTGSIMAWFVDFGFATADVVDKMDPTLPAWCVRGGMNTDQY